MRRLVVALVAAAIAAGAGLACNSVLGIDAANPEPTGDDAGDDGGPAPDDYGHYCDLVMKNCTGDRAEYLTRHDCDLMSPALDLGSIGDKNRDTIGCRITHAAAAAADAGECIVAGPLGGGQCGDPCEAFCAMDLAYCGQAMRPVAYDGGLPECMADCAKYVFLNDGGVPTQTSGNTLDCRLYHLESAYVSDTAAITHCPHTGLVSATCN